MRAAPRRYISLWYELKSVASEAAPMPMGTSTREIPAKNTSVIRRMRFFSRKADAIYAGRSTVIQQGAKSATIPARNAAKIDALKIISISFKLEIRISKFETIPNDQNSNDKNCVLGTFGNLNLEFVSLRRRVLLRRTNFVLRASDFFLFKKALNFNSTLGVCAEFVSR